VELADAAVAAGARRLPGVSQVSPGALFDRFAGGGWGATPGRHQALEAAAPPGPLTPRLQLGRLTETLPRIRMCCLLAPHLLIDPAALGTHNGADEVSGLIYTGGAGFVDLGHARETCDITKHVLDAIAAASSFPLTVATVHGTATVLQRPADAIRVARAISYADALGHEIWTYDISEPGGHNSAFSPEDLCSNYLGTLLAERAVAAGGGFAAAVTSELSSMLSALGAQTKAESLAAFNRINHRWVEFGSVVDPYKNDYLRRRNFTRIPWKAGHQSDMPTPTWVTKGLGDLTSFYAYEHTVQRTMKEVDFPKELARIRNDAKKPSRYGPSYDKP
jgi:Protein of unknown function (DUF4056)